MALQFGLCTYNSSGYRIWRTSVKGPVLFRWQSSGGWSKVKDEVNLVRPVLGSMLWVPRMAFTLLTGWHEEHLTRENLCHSLIHIDSLPKQEEEKPRRPANTGSPRIKVKAFHTRYRALGPVLIPVYTGSQLAGHPPGSRLPLLTARLAVTSPAAEHHRPMAGTKLYCLVTEAHTCEQLAQGCYAALPRVGFELKTCWSQVIYASCWYRPFHVCFNTILCWLPWMFAVSPSICLPHCVSCLCLNTSLDLPVMLPTFYIANIVPTSTRLSLHHQFLCIVLWVKIITIQ